MITFTSLNNFTIVNYNFINKKEFFADLKKLLLSQKSRCGTSFPLTDLLELPNYYRQALCTLEFGSKETGAINNCEDYVLEYLRDRFHNVLDVDMISPVLRQLKKHDAED